MTVNITPVNDAPVVSAGATLAYTENQTGRVIDNTVTLTDVDDTQIASATVTISSGFTAGDVLAAVTTGTNITVSYNNSTGVLTLSGTDTLARYQQVMRSVTYLSNSETPTQTANTRTVTWQVTDANSDGAGTANSAPVTSTITINALPDPINDTFSTNEDTLLSGSVTDADVGDGSATYTVISAPSHGVLNFNSDGSFTYTPSPDYNGSDNFTYRVTDANGDVATAIATITVNPIVDIANDSSTTKEDTPVKISVLNNDSFAAGATITGVTNGNNGTVVVNADGTVTYTPRSNFFGSDSFTYTVTSGGRTETATVNVTVDAVPDPTNDTFSISEDVPLSSSVADADAGDGPATYTVTGEPSHGSLSFNPDGSFVYTPNPDFNGTDSFTYQVTDANGDVGTAIATITINPVADIANDNNSTNEDTPVKIPVLNNDSFAVGATVTSVTDGSNGKVVINSDGTVTYTPKPDFNGSDSFTYTVTSSGVTETATVNVIVNPVTDIADDSRSTDEDTPVVIPVLDNDSFAAGATVTSVTSGSNGTVVINSDGTVTYTPEPDFNGSDSFTYTVTSGGVTETATVNVTVNPQADIADDSRTTKEDTPVKILVLNNDSFTAGATITAVTNGSNGTVVINSDGTVTYTPNSNFNSSDSFTYTVTSGGVTETATVNVLVDAVPDPVNDAFMTDEDVLVSSSVADTDVGDGLATYAVTSVPKSGILSFNPDGSFIYTPNPDFNGTDSFMYQMTDANGDSATAIATILVKPIADATNDSRVTRKGTPVVINALANDSFESRNAAIQSITQGRNGTANVNRDGTLTYTPKTNFVGTDRFTYTVKSGGVTETAIVSIRVSAPSGPTPNNGSSGPDIVVGTNGDDILNGFSDVDVLRGLGGNDIINGGSSRDVMRGDSGNDVLNGGSGNDDMRAGSGNDILNGGSGHDLMLGGTENDILNGGLGNDRLYGEAGRDTLDGGDGNDRLHSGLGNDILRGGRGDDLLIGEIGKDTLTGGQGRDQFIYTSIRDFGDVITDFEIVKDRINFRQIQDIQSMSSLRFTQKSNDTLLRANINGSLVTVAVLEDVNASTLSQRHFIF
ncbi:MAG: tandem-95 repeat protein [Leptolyngbyaceae cyanobacterium RM2_2_4]|nr:tandem-95 repeat protein [Leptolyngbyaceae cyanobacterium RM2_2_4]